MGSCRFFYSRCLFLFSPLSTASYYKSLIFHHGAQPPVHTKHCKPMLIPVCLSSSACINNLNQNLTSACWYLGNSSAHGMKFSFGMRSPHGRTSQIHSSLASEQCSGLAGEFLKMKLRQLGHVLDKWLMSSGLVIAVLCSFFLISATGGKKREKNIHMLFHSTCLELFLNLPGLKISIELICLQSNLPFRSRLPAYLFSFLSPLFFWRTVQYVLVRALIQHTKIWQRGVGLPALTARWG